MRRFAYVVGAGMLAACGGGSSTVGPHEFANGGPFEAWVTALGSRSVGDGAGGIATVPVLFVATAANTTHPTHEIWLLPNTVRAPSGEVIAPSTLAVGRKVRVWQADGPVLASAPLKIGVDSIIVLK